LTIKNLDKLFHPEFITVIGETIRASRTATRRLRINARLDGHLVASQPLDSGAHGPNRTTSAANSPTLSFRTSDIKGQSFGITLLEKIIHFCTERGTSEMIGQTLRQDKATFSLAKSV